MFSRISGAAASPWHCLVLGYWLHSPFAVRAKEQMDIQKSQSVTQFPANILLQAVVLFFSFPFLFFFFEPLKYLAVQWNTKKSLKSSLDGVAQWIECRLQTKGSLVQFPVRAHAWVVGQVPSRGHVRGNHTLIFLSLPFSLPSPFSKNK